MSRIRSYRNTKDANMTLRCTKEEKERIVRKAKQDGKCIGEYLLDSAIAGSERRSKKTGRSVSRSADWLYKRRSEETGRPGGAGKGIYQAESCGTEIKPCHAVLYAGRPVHEAHL